MKKKTFSNIPTSFLQKTYEMLEDESLKETICWNDDGDAFIIKNINEFSEAVLPRYFKHNNLASFVRQLNMYDFHKCRNTGYDHVFKHPLFIRGRFDLLKDITRKTSESNWSLIPRNSISNSELSPLLQKLYQLHKRGLSSEAQIKTLEQKVAELTEQNKMLVNQLMESRDRMKKIENVLMMMANYMQSQNGTEFKFSVEPSESYLPITHVQPSKKHEFWEELEPEQDLFEEDLCFDEDKLDFLLDS